MGAATDEIHVLCVEDEPQYAELIETYLERHDDLTVSTVQSASAALDMLADDAAGVDCVVSDYDMPDRTGVELLQAVRDQYDELPFIIFTGKGSEAVAAEAVQAGVDNYLQKGGPDTYELLATQIRQQVQQHRAEQATERYETIIEALGDAVYVTDERGHFVYVNEAFTDLTGYEKDALIGEHPSIIKSEGSVAVVERTLRQLLRGDGPDTATIEVEIQTRDGETIPCEDHIGVLPSTDGTYRGSVGTLRDMSDRLRRERQLQREQTRATVLFEQSPLPIARIQFVDSEPIVTAVNSAFEETFGHLEPEVTDKSLDAFIVAPEAESHAAELNRRVSAGETVTVELERQTVDDPRQFRLVATPVKTEYGREGYATYIDITDERQRTQALQERVREYEGLSDVMAHDLRNTLHVATGRLDLARETGDDSHLEAAEQALDQLDALIGDLSEVLRSGQIADEITDVDVGDLSAEVWEPMATPEARLHHEEAGTIRADPQALKRLFENLFQNSLQHAGPDVTVRVGWLPGGFYVEDDGPGIAAEHRAEAFVPGYSTAEDGTGFGLVSVRQIAAGHGWEVQLAEGQEGGLRVEFTNVETQ